MSANGDRSIYLIKHAEPMVRPDVPPGQWTLSHRGVEQGRALAEAAKGWRVAAVYSSHEPKAASTALIIADGLALQARVVEGVEELRIGGWVANADEFNERVRQALEQPGRRAAPGAETAAAGVRRFEAALEVIARGELPAAVVSHGRILAAYLAHGLGEPDAFAVWRSIPLGSVARLAQHENGLRLIERFAELPTPRT